ncbi:hypothetical protein DBB29_00035 [Pandoraea cepalis]|uniref:F plasmid gene 32-like protein n=2 Tax=Pandoraea cepalis TaxID=2508294 RepID=A0AAW7MG02_9BURK|nr:hypothetical protein [Pandoraea cepalis]MDN4576529.1 hypothetical protein [Pandoraea cepalis]
MRNRHNEPMTDDQIRKVAPSVFADEKHESRSDRYAYIPTSQVLDALRAEGFQPYMAIQQRVNDPAKREHTKHLIRFRHATQMDAPEWPELLLMNSHDGTSSYKMMTGMFRLVCSNGMVCGRSLGEIAVPHKGNVLDKVRDGANEILDGFGLITEVKDSMRTLPLNEGERLAFARAALALRYDEKVSPAPITETQILRPRRSSDTGTDMWTTFNVLQENITRGGISGRNATGKRTTTRAITGLDSNVGVNRGLWVLAEEMKKLKR